MAIKNCFFVVSESSSQNPSILSELPLEHKNTKNINLAYINS